MDSIKIATYIFSGSVCLSMAIILLFVKSIAISENIAYRNIKRILAYSALIDVFIDILVIILLGNKSKLINYEYFIIPSAYCMQLLLMTGALLGLIHTPLRIRTTFNKAFLPLFAIMAIYFVGYLLNVSNFSNLSFQGFTEYNSTPYGRVSCNILYIFILICFVYCLYTLISKTKLYLKKLNNYYSGNEVIKGKQISYIAYCFFGYFILAALDFIISNGIINTYIMTINTFIFIYFVCLIMNIEKSFIITQKLDDFEMSEHGKSIESVINTSLSVNISSKSLKDDSIDTTEKTEYSIISAIHKWEQRVDKPYLKDGILIADVSNSLGLNDVQLSFILNHSLKVNFNTWINKLRIEESKHLIKENPKFTLSEVAHSSGFSDLASFSKAFKKVTGESPSVYKRTIHA